MSDREEKKLKDLPCYWCKNWQDCSTAGADASARNCREVGDGVPKS